MTYIIDAHEDIACSALTFNRDLCISAHDTRKKESGTQIPIWGHGETTLGWPDYQRSKVGLVFATLFTAPAKFSDGEWDVMSFKDSTEAEALMRKQIDYYQRLSDDHPDKFQLVRNQSDLKRVLDPWEKDLPGEHPVGLVLLMEGADGLSSPVLLEEFYERGLRMVGPAWGGTRYFGGSREDLEFSKESRQLLDMINSLDMPLDISHMRESGALAAMDHFDGSVFASHANALSKLKGSDSPRHLTDTTIHRVFEHGGVIGVVLFNLFLSTEWNFGSPRELVTLKTVAEQIDYYCQLSGSSKQVAIGTDFDGGFGFPNIPLEMDTIGDLQKLGDVLREMGYTAEDVENIFHRNWKYHLERNLPA
jgi:membrane dipeptidase